MISPVLPCVHYLLHPVSSSASCIPHPWLGIGPSVVWTLLTKLNASCSPSIPLTLPHHLILPCLSSTTSGVSDVSYIMGAGKILAAIPLMKNGKLSDYNTLFYLEIKEKVHKEERNWLQLELLRNQRERMQPKKVSL